MADVTPSKLINQRRKTHMTKALAVIATLSAAFAAYFLLRQEPSEKSSLESQVVAIEETAGEYSLGSSDGLPTTVNINAVDLFDNALAEAKRQNKNVFLVFDGPSCPPCKVLKEFLAQQAGYFDRDYLIVHIEMERMENAEFVKDKFTSDPSVPLIVIVNSAADVLGTSVGEKGNIGFPTSVEECRHFMSMIQKSAIRSDRSNFEQLARELNDFAEPIRLVAEKEKDATIELNPEPWTGEWDNIDADKPDITRLLVSLDGKKLSIRAFGKCEPTDCDWGSTELRLCRVNGSKNETVAFGKWDHGFEDSFVILRLKDGRMSCEAFSIYKDHSERDCIVITETFHRSKPEEGVTNR